MAEGRRAVADALRNVSGRLSPRANRGLLRQHGAGLAGEASARPERPLVGCVCPRPTARTNDAHGQRASPLLGSTEAALAAHRAEGEARAAAGCGGAGVASATADRPLPSTPRSQQR